MKHIKKRNMHVIRIIDCTWWIVDISAEVSFCFIGTTTGPEHGEDE